LPTNIAKLWLLPAAALLAGVLGADAVWVVVAVASGRPCSWMALLAAVDVAFMLRLAGVRPGAARVLVAVLATAFAVALAQWLVVATQLGMLLGLEPLESATRLGPHLAKQLLMISLGRADYAWLLASLPLAALLSLSARPRPAPPPACPQ
jgi:hypothetical protein